jgi:hypothetical protein
MLNEARFGTGPLRTGELKEIFSVLRPLREGAEDFEPEAGDAGARR